MPGSEKIEATLAALAHARHASHGAIQWASRAARANLDARPDDGHSNLGWDDALQALMSHSLGSVRFGLAFRETALVCSNGAQIVDSHSLIGATDSALATWCDARLVDAGLVSTDAASLPYRLPAPEYRVFAKSDVQAGLATLGGLYALSHRALSALVADVAGDAARAPAVRCWPHHYDLAVLVELDATAAESDSASEDNSARSIGTGLSPGDEHYDEPYFYCSAYPTPTEPPDAPPAWHWHTDGFTSMICPVRRLIPDLDDASLNAATGAVHAALADAYRVARLTL